MTTYQAIGTSLTTADGPTIRSRSQPLPLTDPARLAPEDAFTAHSPPRRLRDKEAYTQANCAYVDADLTGMKGGGKARRRRDKERGRSRSRRNNGVWKKLLWVKQSYPDNYTDPPTFLSHLQRNPRLQPYDFWPLVADSTVIVQHICSVALFICCFVGIFQERISPVSVVSWGTAGTVLGWVLWDFWVSQEEASNRSLDSPPMGVNGPVGDAESTASNGTSSPTAQRPEVQGVGLGLSLTSTNLQPRYGHSQSTTSAPSVSSSTLSSPPNGLSNPVHHTKFPQYHSTSPFSHRNQQRLATAKSAILIYCALLGLSPILKSLTKSTSSDSIWALSCWLMCINVFFFDYGGGVGVKHVISALNADSHPPFPASLSTNAALMASTVLASRLPSTTHVFSLTLFSIEVFGLFPVFRRHLRHISWRGHLLLTLSLVIGAGAGMGVTLVRDGDWKAAIVGVVLWGLGTMVGMGGCSWWLIGLQKYKNVVIGPWDPARPVIRQWE